MPFDNSIWEQTTEKVVTSSRIFNSPIEKMFRAWTDPKHLQVWWGPKGFTNTFHEYDLRTGGEWHFIMHGPEGGNYQNDCIFLKIEKPNLIIWDHISPPVFQIEVSFEEKGTDQTMVIFKMVFRTEEECNKIRTLVTEKNEENFDKLEIELQKMD
jgi:uncharacterized protein YndB with AHSA1/START domain